MFAVAQLITLLCALLLVGFPTRAGAHANSTTTTTSSRPNLVVILVDDLGYNYPGYHNAEIKSPTLDKLAREEGVILESAYTYKYCAPTRGSLLTGRYPYHLVATRCNLIPSTIPEGISLGYEMLPARLASAGYVSHHVGKWHQGFHTPAYMPVSRGFNSSFGFLQGGQDHYTQWCGASHANCHFDGQPKKNGGAWDIWQQDSVVPGDFPGKPGYGLNGSRTQWSGDNSRYNGYRFPNKVVSHIRSHKAKYGAKTPFFTYYAVHNTHAPVQAPERFINMYNFSGDELKNVFSAMVSAVDEAVLNITTALKEEGMWNNTLVVWMTDNGSPVQVAGSNHPLRGGKGTNWEGGVRVPAFVTGGYLPAAARGRTLHGLFHVADIYATFEHLAGLTPGSSADEPNAPAAPDSLNQWGYISGTSADSPRSEIVHDHYMFTNASGVYGCVGQAIWELPGYSALGALRMGDYKLIVGPNSEASWYGAFSPNTTGVKPDLKAKACGARPCLFNVVDDPGEHNDLAEVMPERVTSMLARFKTFDHSHHPPVVPPAPLDDAFCTQARRHRGFTSPYVTPVPEK